MNEQEGDQETEAGYVLSLRHRPLRFTLVGMSRDTWASCPKNIQ